MAFALTAIVLIVVPFAAMQASDNDAATSGDRERAWASQVVRTVEACGTQTGDFHDCATREQLLTFGLDVPPASWGTDPGQVSVTGVSDTTFIVQGVSKQTPEVTYTVVHRADGNEVRCEPKIAGRCSG